MWRKFLLNFSFHFSRWVGDMHLPFTRKKIGAKEYRDILKFIEPGDMLLTRTHGELSNLFIPGSVKHSAMFCRPGEGDVPCIVHSTGRGVWVQDLTEFLFTKDRIVVVRPKFSPEIRKKASEVAHSYVGRPYDYQFLSDNEALYCAELNYQAYKVANDGKEVFELTKRFTEMTITPYDLLKSKFNEIIYPR